MGFVDLHSDQILNSWYQNYIQPPNPTDNEVHELVQLSELTRKQVKKGMANKRVRCFNTLTINGNQRPIKFKRIKKDMSAFQPMTSESRKISNEWCETKLENLYPTDEQKEELAMKTG
jgi:hypothetical protein